MLKVFAVLAILLPGNPPVVNRYEVEDLATCHAKITEYLERVSQVNETFQAVGQCLIAKEKQQEG